MFVGEQEIKELSSFFGKRYKYWLDFSKYHCSKNGLKGEEEDVLMKVIEDVWSKDKKKLFEMYRQKSTNGTGLDFYILKMLRVYIKMPKAPYRWKYHTRVVKKKEVETYDNLPVIEYELEQDLGDTLDMVKDLIYCNHFSKEVIRILEWIFIKGNKDFENWPGAEKKEVLEDVFEKALEVLRKQVTGERDKDGQLSIFNL